MPFEGFGHPALVWGLLATSVPLLLHLLNRRRYRRLRWAAMDFLLAAYRRTRRRLRMENLLLLLARCGAVAALALALARPFTKAGGVVAALAEGRRDRIVVLDASYSMGYRDGAQTPFERAVEVARGLLEGARPDRGERASVVLLKERPDELRAGGPEEVRRALGALGDEGPSLEGADLLGTLGLVDRVAESFGGGGALTVSILTDLQRRTLLPPSDEGGGEGSLPAERIREAIRRLVLERSAKVEFVDVGPPSPRPPNLGVVEVRPDRPEEGFFAGSEVSFRVEVRNFGAAPVAVANVRFLVDGNPKSVRTVENLEGNGAREVVFTEAFLESGAHAVEAALEADELRADDRRAFAFAVRPPVRVLLVESGPPDPDPFLTKTGFLYAALDPGERIETAPFQPAVIERSRFNSGEESLADFDAVVLADVDFLSDAVVERLESFVAAGGALLFFLGEDASPEYYNRRFEKPDGPGLLPARLLERRGSGDSRSESYYTIRVLDPEYPGLRFFHDSDWAPLLTEQAVWAFVAVEPEPDARVPAVYAGDPASPPFLVERLHGLGRVAIVTTNLHLDWIPGLRLPLALIPFLFDLLRHLTSGVPEELNLPIGRPLRLELPRAPLRASWIDPSGARTALSGNPRPLGPDRWALPETEETRSSGVHRIEVETAGPRGGTETVEVKFAVRVDPDEGDLARLDAAAVREHYPEAEVRAAGATAVPGEDEKGEDRGELWRALAAAALGFLLADSALAAFFGRRRV